MKWEMAKWETAKWETMKWEVTVCVSFVQNYLSDARLLVTTC